MTNPRSELDQRYERLLDGRARIVGVLRASGAASARRHALAAIDAGLAAIEITWTTPGAAAVVRDLTTANTGASIGAGTLLHASEAEDAIAAGAAFLVSPHLAQGVREVAAAHGTPYVPGAATATEVVRAMEAGCPVVKLFPVRELGGPAFVRALRGPFPDLAAMVTGGVGIDDVPAYLSAGARIVGLGAVFGNDAEETRSLVRRALAKVA